MGLAVLLSVGAVYKKNAVAIGTGKLIYGDYYLFGYNLMFCEVKKADIQKSS
jgi:hypothetical protein